MSTQFLPEPLPEDPMPIFTRWFEEAVQRALQPNPNAMALATADAEGHPSARIVLAKELVADPGYVVFYTNYGSRKARDLAARPRAAAVLHWDHLYRQVRLTGTVTRSPSQESDAYFAARPLASRIGAWASRQSEPLESRAALARQVRAVEARFGVAPGATVGDVPRPPHWGGLRLLIATLELWVEGPGRVHDRAIWTRDVTASDRGELAVGPWSATRLNP